MTEKIKDQILKVRATARTNMFSIYDVQYIANELALYELVLFLEDKKNWGEYTHFIITGK